MSLKVVKPIEVLPGMLTSSIGADDYPAWNADTTYAAEFRVVHESSIYQSLQGANIGNLPSAGAVWWVRVGAINRMKAFDLSHTTKTRFADSAWFEIQLTEAVNAFAMLECDGIRSVRITMTHPSYGDLYDVTVPMYSMPQTSGWYEWAYGERREQSVLYLFDLPSYRNAKVRIEIESASDAGVGVILLGQQKDIGLGVSPGLQMGIRDYSRKETDEWGDAVLKKRAYARDRSFRVTCPMEELDSVDRFLSDMRATAALWLLSSRYERANVYGWFTDYRVLVDYGSYCVLSLQLQGLI